MRDDLAVGDRVRRSRRREIARRSIRRATGLPNENTPIIGTVLLTTPWGKVYVLWHKSYQCRGEWRDRRSWIAARELERIDGAAPPPAAPASAGPHAPTGTEED